MGEQQTFLTPKPRNPSSLRMAVIQIDGEILPDVIGLFRDVGIDIIGSVDSLFFPHRHHDDAYPARLILRGDALPEECEHGAHIVTATFVQETYGNQRIVKIAKFDVVGEWEMFGKAA